jgi:release factor glutamine methyltransferase
MKLAELLTQSTAKLEAAGVYSPRADAEIIVSKILDLPRVDIAEKGERELDINEQRKISEALARREKREPIARIFDGSQFFGLPIRLEKGVFEPLLESESLVEYALLFLQGRGGNPRVLDIGTGTGCLLLGVLSGYASASGLGVDISKTAIDLAFRNAERVKLSSRSEFRVNDWTKGLEGPFDLILCNPPFIPKRLIKTLVPEVRTHDPGEALNGGSDGMRFYKKLAHDFARLAAPEGMGLFQVSLTFADRVKRLFERAGYEAEIRRNYFGIPVAVAIFSRKPPGFQAWLARWAYGKLG